MVVTRSAEQGTAGHAVGPGCAATIGNFDGVHRGHRALLDRVAARARELGAASCVLTFDPHPREFFSRAGEASPPARLTRLRDKLELISAAGIDRVHLAHFDARFAALSAEQFVDRVLVREMAVRWLVVGRDFRYGRDRRGDFAALAEAAAQQDFRLEAMPEVLVDGERVSSSAVRAALKNGELRRAERLLGHPYFISGRVARGARLGRSLGYPTANIPLWRSPPLSGIYVVEVENVGPGVASVGRRPTVNPVERPLLEVHLLDFDRDLYGSRLRVRFLEKLREEEKYDGLPQLKAAIARDVDRAQEYFERHG